MPTTRWVLGSLSENKVHVANVGPTWVLSAPCGPHVGPMNLAIRVVIYCVTITKHARYWIFSLIFWQQLHPFAPSFVTVACCRRDVMVLWQSLCSIQNNHIIMIDVHGRSTIESTAGGFFIDKFHISSKFKFDKTFVLISFHFNWKDHCLSCKSIYTIGKAHNGQTRYLQKQKFHEL